MKQNKPLKLFAAKAIRGRQMRSHHGSKSHQETILQENLKNKNITFGKLDSSLTKNQAKTQATKQKEDTKQETESNIRKNLTGSSKTS